MGNDVDWVRAFNRLFQIIDREGPAYFSGSRFISKVREVDPYFPSYDQYIARRRQNRESTTRRDFYYDIFLEFDAPSRMRLFHLILDEVEPHFPDKAQELRALLGGAVPGPAAEISADAWSADRLNRFLSDIDNSLAAGDDDRAVSLSYSCLEGFYKAFIRKRVPGAAGLTELLDLSKEIRRFLSISYPGYPDEVLNMITHVSHAVDRARNRFSESHFEGEAARWLAVYVRDLVNTQIRLLLHFFGE